MSNNDSPLDSSKPNLEQVLSLVQNLQQAMDKQRAEFTAQKNELEVKINKLERTVQEKQSVQEVAVVEARTSRRKMLRRLGAVAAGVAVAASVTVRPTNVSAATTTFELTGTSPNIASGESIISADIGTIIEPGAISPLLTINNTRATGTLLDGVKVAVTAGVALSGTTQGTSKAAVQGITGNSADSTLTSLINTSTNKGAIVGAATTSSTHGISGIATGSFSSGVYGLSQGGSGVLGISSTTYGGHFKSVSTSTAHAQFKLEPHSQTGTPSSGTPGEMYVDVNGVFWIYSKATPSSPSAQWNLMSAVSPTLGPQLTLLPAPVRLFDSAAGVGMSPAGQVTGFNAVVPTDLSIVPYTKTFETRSVNSVLTGVPISATAIFGVISVYYFYAGAAFGYITLWPTGSSYPKADATRGVVSIGTTPNSVVTSYFLNKISTSTGQLNVATQRDCHIIVDCYGYYS
jgi:hypothetical protein